MIKLMTAGAFALGAALSAAPVQAQQYNGRYDNRSLVCTSQNNRYHECPLPFRGRAMLVRQLSNASCIEGRSWGQRRGAVWVNRGCRARFEMVRSGVHQGMDPRRDGQGQWNDNHRNDNYTITCESNDNRMTRCNWDARYGSPRLVQRLSDSSCNPGRDWGYDNRNSLWVDHGCRARFSNR